MKSPVYQLSIDAAFEVFDDGGLILNLKDVTFTELNITARDIVQATDGKKSLDEVAEVIAREYEIDLGVARTDVKELYDDLKKQGIIERLNTKETEEG